MDEPQNFLSRWPEQYRRGQTGWDMGYVSPPLKAYFDQLTDKNLRILIPGAGKGWEVAYLHGLGFHHVVYLDVAPEAAVIFQNHCPGFESSNIIIGDFFAHQGQYDLIVEQTFFCALPPASRKDYVHKTHALLKAGGKIVGLLFNHQFSHQGPPYGGNPEEYRELFKEKFTFKTFEPAYNSIAPRQNREHFVIFEKK